jgi:hypothetical protein
MTATNGQKVMNTDAIRTASGSAIRKKPRPGAFARITPDQAKDTGMAMVLILLILALASGRELYVSAAIVVHLLNMIAPLLFRAIAVVWLGFAHVLGNVMSRLVLLLIFMLVVTPIGLVRRWAGADSMQLKRFKSSRESVMQRRNHAFTSKDLEHPY